MVTKFRKDHISEKGRRKRALLDTNVWRYVVDCRAQGALLQLTRHSPYDVQIAPGVLYETLRLKDTSLRADIVRLMTSSHFHRLMPEAYSESMEVLREIERARPDWLRDIPHLQFFNRLKNDWTRISGGFWVRCRRSPESEARFLNEAEDGLFEAAREQSHLARKEMISAGWKRNPSMDKTLAGFHGPVPGWRGTMVEAWRMDSLAGLTYGLSRPGNAYRDWIAPFVELDNGLLTSAAWVEFWLHLADKSAMPRQWMRWAHAFAQRFRKVTTGSPGDTQLFTYFLETDIVVTADKALIEILEECRPYAPCELPDGKLICAGAEGVANLLHMLET